MKTKFILFSFYLTATFLGCKTKETIPPPTVYFSLAANNLLVDFTNYSTNGRYFDRDFGDNTPHCSQINPGHAYEDGGIYTVKLNVTGRNGSKISASKQITVKEIPNLVAGGKMKAGDESKWIKYTINGNHTAGIVNGKMEIKGGEGWSHTGFYQKITVEANKTYSVDMLINCNGGKNAWCEVYVGKTVPPGSSDYNDGGQRLGLGWNTWCYGDNKPVDGVFSSPSINCGAPNKNTFSFTQGGDAYLVVRVGGKSLGNGVYLDNVAITEKK